MICVSKNGPVGNRVGKNNLFAGLFLTESFELIETDNEKWQNEYLE